MHLARAARPLAYTNETKRPVGIKKCSPLQPPTNIACNYDRPLDFGMRSCWRTGELQTWHGFTQRCPAMNYTLPCVFLWELYFSQLFSLGFGPWTSTTGCWGQPGVRRSNRAQCTTGRWGPNGTTNTGRDFQEAATPIG